MSDATDNFDDDFRTAAEANSRQAADLEKRLLDRIEKKLDTMDAKEASSALQAVANMKARNIEKLRGLGAAPPSATDPTDLLGSMLKKKYIRLSGPAAALGLEAAGDEEERS